MLCKDTTDDYSTHFEASGFELVDLHTTIEVEGPSLQHGVSYFITVRAVHRNKLRSAFVTSSHEGLLVDTTGPLASGLTIGPPESRINVFKRVSMLPS